MRINAYTVCVGANGGAEVFCHRSGVAGEEAAAREIERAAADGWPGGWAELERSYHFVQGRYGLERVYHDEYDQVTRRYDRKWVHVNGRWHHESEMPEVFKLRLNERGLVHTLKVEYFLQGQWYVILRGLGLLAEV